MSKYLPFPILSSTIFLMWVLLTGFSPGHIIMGALIGVFVARVMLLLKPEMPKITYSAAIPKLIGMVAKDVVRSNLNAVTVILGRRKKREAGFVNVQLRIRNPYALSALSIICTATPGTLWVQHDPSCHQLLLHFWDLSEAEEWLRYYEEDFEPLLMEIFE